MSKLKEEFWFSQGYYVACEGLDGWHAGLVALYDMAYIRTMRLMCHVLGHRMVGTGYGDGDSGGEGWDCTRCGESHWHQYY